MLLLLSKTYKTNIIIRYFSKTINKSFKAYISFKPTKSSNCLSECFCINLSIKRWKWLNCSSVGGLKHSRKQENNETCPESRIKHKFLRTLHCLMLSLLFINLIYTKHLPQIEVTVKKHCQQDKLVLLQSHGMNCG